MDISSDEWEKKALENITRYLHRGGEFKGDEPQFIGGSELINTIGMAMGLPAANPENWSKHELEEALNGQLVFFEGTSREAIDPVEKQILSCCKGDSKIYVTVLPVEIYFEGKLYELPVFRVKRHKNAENYYVDNTGRCYSSFLDWFKNNKLPFGKMAYPHQLKLCRNAPSNEALVDIDSTPAAGVWSKTARAVDTVTAVAGLGSSVALLFVTGGLAAPLIGTAVVTAGWGTTRAGYQLIEKSQHGENVDPFQSSESRMLWLGIAANLTSFGAMGASMRLTSMAARGREISTALQVTTNIVNGASIAVSGLAIINSTIFVIENFDDLSAVDILMHSAAVAFWTKGLYSYKTAKTIIKESQNRAFTNINKELSRDEAAELSDLRSRLKNDNQLLQKYHAALSSNISLKTYTQFLLDGMRYYDTVANLSPEQVEAFYSIRNFIRDDLNLITGLRSVSHQYNLNPTETVETVINMWQKMNTMNLPSETNTFLKEGNLILGQAPPVKIAQLPKLSPPLIRFLGEHLSRIDVVSSHQWATSIDTLLNLQNRGMFSCVVTRLVTNSGRAVIVLNGQLEISIYKLQILSENECKHLFKMISKLAPNDSSSKLSADLVKLCVQGLRLRLECHRSESVLQITQYVYNHNCLRELLTTDLHSFEKDRLYTFASEIVLYKASNYVEDMMKFVSEMCPKSISELVAYSEFVMTCVEEHAITLKAQIRRKEVELPRNETLSAWTRQQAAIKVFQDINSLKVKFDKIIQIIDRNNMVGVTTLAKDLGNEQLIEAIKGKNIRFGSKVSAAYHVVKHPIDPLDDFVSRANKTIREATEPIVRVGQDGEVRIIEFLSVHGRSFVLEKQGRVLLCTFIPNH